MSDERLRTEQPSRRQKTRHPGVYWRPTKKGRSYEISYVDSAGKRQFKTVPGGEKDAVRARAQILERMHRGEMVAPSKMTVAELADLYIDTATSHLRDSTRTCYQEYINAHVKPKLGRLKVHELRAGHVADVVAGMRDSHSPYTIDNVLKPLSGMYRLAVRRGWAASNPVRQLDKDEKPKGRRSTMRILSTEEIAAVLRNSGHYRLLLETAIFTGLRVGELSRLKWEDIDWTNGVLTVTESKTEAGEGRQVVIPRFLLEKLAGANGTHGYVFTQEKSGRPINDVIGRRALEHALRGPKNDEGEYDQRVTTDRVRFHDLRHTFASILVGQGEDITYVSDQMGHANPAITLSIYARLYDPRRRREEAAAKLNDAFQEVAA